jgi:hypothetical protein
MCKKVWTIAKIDLKTIKSSYFTTALIFAIIFVQSIIYTIIAYARGAAGGQLSISGGSYFWLLIAFAAVSIPTKNFRKIINLGGKRNDFFWGSLECYAILALAVTIVSTLFYYTYERFLLSSGYYAGFDALMQNAALMDPHYSSVHVPEIFGWTGNGHVVAFIQQFAFLFLAAVVIHTITAIQDKWYGWVTDAMIAAILGVFILIVSLRAHLLNFFGLIIFNSNPGIQISVCVALAVVIYSFNKPVFARKAI